MTALPAPSRPYAPARLWTDAPAFTALALLILLAMAPLLLAMALDPRLSGAEDIWLKPLKFHIALAIYLITLAAFARWLPEGMRASRRWRGFVALVCLCVLAELLWIGGAAAMGTTSHFNLSSPLWQTLYSLMGLAAVTLTSASLVMGLAIHRNPATGLHPAVKLSVVHGLILTFLLTVLTAGYMASTPGHHVGTPVTGATLPLFGWSREVGDLRVSHFLATHALHALPLWGLAMARLAGGPRSLTLVRAGSLAFTLLVLATFAQAIAGQPLF